MSKQVRIRYRVVTTKVQLFKRNEDWVLCFKNWPGWPKDQIHLLPYASWERAHEGLLCLLREANRNIQTRHMQSLL